MKRMAMSGARQLVSVVLFGLAACGGSKGAPAPEPASGGGATPPAAGGQAAAPAPQTGVFVADIERKADACTDFFEFANGAWRAQNPIPPSMPRWSRRWQSGELAKDQLKGILEEVSARKDWPAASVEQLTGDFYISCMDEARVDQEGIEPLKPFLAEIAALRDRGQVQKMILRLHQAGVAVPFGVASGSDYHSPNDVIAQLFAGGIGLPDRDYYVKSEKRFVEARDKYRAHVTAIFKLAGHDARSAAAAARLVMAMETRLAKASLDNVALRDPKNTDHKMAVPDLKKLSPHFDWAVYFDSAKMPSAQLNVSEPAFIKAFDREIAKTSVADWRTYLEWHLLRRSAPWLSRPFVEEDFAFNERYLQGSQELKPRWKRCVELTDQLLGEALGQKYTEKYFPPAAKARMQDLVKNLLAAMHDTIEQLDWMSPETKKRALEKLATFNPKIGYPDKWKDYSSIKIQRDTFLANVEGGARWNVDDDWSTIGKPVDRGRWGMTPPTSNAYYNPLLNEIVFPAGILQPPAFSMDFVDAVNYGAIGVVIGHEISHGFDDSGAQFDAEGKLNNWWTAEDLKHFTERGQCVVDQFEQYFVEPGIHHNGKLVLGESIGDLAGAQIAYRAYQKAQETNPAATIDGFTPDQQFFIAWGQFRGDAIRPETQRLMVQSDPHPIGKYRVIGPLSNMPEFQKAFGCKPDAAMVRPEAKRCDVW
ncbi:MAG TPA: M13 family metallopeptidase [Kofleriaceae bacterium]|nr:M13 family metallopeptidase [Kofleriaceae bacterium]